MSVSTIQFHLGAQEILKTVQFGPLVDALEAMHREAPADVKDMLLEQPGSEETDYCLIRAAWQRGEALGVKIASIFPKTRHLSFRLSTRPIFFSMAPLAYLCSLLTARY